MFRKISAYLLVFLVASLAYSVSAADLYNAAGTIPVSVPKNPTEQNQPANSQEDALQIDCKEIQNTISEKVTMYATLKPEVLLKFQSLELMLTAYVEKAEVLGYDTTTLENDIRQLKLLVNTFTTKQDGLQNQLRVASSSACGTNEENYINNIVRAKSSLLEVQDSIKDIRDYYQMNVRNSVLTLSQEGTANE